MIKINLIIVIILKIVHISTKQTKKEETSGMPITEFIGLRSKMYSCIKDNNQVGKTAKGILKNIIKNNIKHEDYKDVLFNNRQIHNTMKTIRSNLHQLGSYELNKVSLSCFDDKRYIHKLCLWSL